jgi:hypothetical protein
MAAPQRLLLRALNSLGELAAITGRLRIDVKEVLAQSFSKRCFERLAIFAAIRRASSIDLDQSPDRLALLVFQQGKVVHKLIVASGAENASCLCVDHNCNATDLRRRQRNCVHQQ